ncbi:MAG TPA: asparaginase [Gaiellales bacterium]|nr:asparaginase [Gaiellales bacterium]
METGVVEEVRGGVVEARHRVHAVMVDASGAVLASSGDPEWPCMLRSAAKPLQALPAVRDGVVERYELAARHVAVACGSHEGTPAHAAAVAEVIARAGLSVADLRPRGVHPPLAPAAARALALAGRTPTVLEHNCSGNHALMLLRESMLGRDPSAYLDPDGPAQADATEAVALACECELVIAGDRCGMRAYSLPLRNAALGYLRLAGHGMPEPYAEAARGVAGAMREAPEMVAGPGSFDSLANALPHVVAKRGALGVFCCASAETGRGGALKVEDGSFEAMEIAALTLLEAVGGPVGEAFDPWRERPIRDGNGAQVGSWSRTFPVL